MVGVTSSRAWKALSAAVAMVVAFAVVVIAPQSAQAAPGDASASGVTIGLNANLLGVPLVNLSGTVGSAVAPPGGGTSNTGVLDVGAGLGAGLGVTAGGTVTTISATRSASQSSATAQIAGVNIGVLGINAVQTGAVQAQAVCTAGGTPTATASVANLVLLGQAVTLNATTPTVSTTAAVNVAGLVGARLAATAQQVTTTSATGATATAVLVSLTLQTNTIGVPSTINLGTIQLASATCTSPAAAASSLAPTSGPTRGGTSVTVTGAGLQNTTGVTFGGTPAASFTVAADGTTVTAVAPASETAGAVPVTLVRPTGNLTPGNFTYVAPTVTAVSPPQGSTAGGTQVTVTGTGLLGATGVTFGGTAGTLVGTPTDTSITVATPAHAAGPVAVTAVLPGLDGTLADGFTYVVPTAPIITGFTPTQGVAAGGTTVTVTGSNLAAVNAVTFGGTPGTIVGTPTATSLTVTTPAHAVGPVDVVLSGTGGTTTAPGQYTYLDDGSQATLTGITPATVPTAGGTNLTITGTGLTGATGVTVNGVPATVVSVAADGVVATAPVSETAGPAEVRVQFPAGERAAGTVDYVAPALTAVSPGTGPSSGGTTLTLTGTGLATVTEVTVGGTPATIVGTPSDTAITVTAPAHAPGAVDVVAVLPGADATATDAFTYLDDGTGAVVTAVVPATSPTSGGGTLTISGSGLGAVTDLTIGGVAVADLDVAPDGTTVTGTIPASDTAGSAAVELTFPAGTVDAGALIYVAPAITAVSPSQGPNEGGTAVTLTGTGFTGATDLVLGGDSLPFTVVSDTEITFTTPAHPAGLVDISVTLPGLDATAPDSFAFLLDGVATVDAVTPDEGPTSGGTTVTITGTALESVTAVAFDGIPATIVGTPTAGSVTVTSPAHPAPGPVTLTITNESGDSLLPGGFTYLADGTGVTVGSLTPAEVPTAGNVTVTLDGTGFTGATGITVGGQPATDVVVAADGTSITFTVPATETAGAAPVVIQFPLGDAPAGELTYVAPSVDTIDPAEGPVSGGTTVTLTGTGLERATGVTFAGAAATDLTVVGPGVISVTTPAGAAGAVDVVVELPGADATLTDGFTYLVDGSDADVADVDPDTLPTAGGTVTITGTGLTGATEVTVGGIALTGLTVSDTAVSGTLPASETAGAQPVVIAFPAGTVDAGTITLVAPELTTVAPTFGVSSGGNTLTLSGTGLSGAETVLVGGEPAAILTATDTELTVTAPAHAPGVVDIVVEFPGADATLPLSYTYLDDGTGATFTAIAPTEVPTAGGVTVTVTGTGLQNAFGVTVAGVLAENPVVAPDGTSVTFVVPATEVAGPATVSVWFPAGAQVAGQIAYVAPAVTAVTPAEGPTSGGTEVTITGSGLTGLTDVLIGGTAATILDSTDTTITLTTPAHIAGTVDVTVVLPGADATAVEGFTYLEDGSGVEVTDVTPTTSSTVGGGTLTVTGTGLGAVTGVTIGGVAADGLEINGAGTVLTVTIPASETAGGAPIVLVLPAGTEAAGTLTYLAPTATTVTPDQGPVAGGTPVTVTGTGLGAVTEVQVDGVAATDLVATDTTVGFTTPAHPAGPVSIVLIQPGLDLTLTDAFTYLTDGSEAVVTGITPDTVPLGGGDTVTIAGTGLTGATGVTVGGVAAADVVVADDGSSITFTAPPGTAPGTVPVVIGYPGGELPAGDLTYADDGTLSTVTGTDPGTSPIAGGGTLTITGTNLEGVTAVTVGGTTVTDVTVSGTTVTLTIPAGATAGDVPITLVFPAGTLPAGTLTYIDDGSIADITGITPTTSSTVGGGTLTITGTGLGGATGVTIGGIDADDFTVNGDGTSITVTIPATEVADPVAVLITFPAGQVDAGTLTYVAPEVTGIDPAQGPTGGDTLVTLTGTGLTGATGVSFGGSAGLDLTVVSDTELTVRAPAHAAGVVDVVIAFPGADATLPDGYEYLADGTGVVVAGITPGDSPVAGGGTLTITGTGLDAVTGVTIGDVAVDGITVNGDGTELTLTIPASEVVGQLPVVLTTPAGDVLAGGLTYIGSTATDLTPTQGPISGGTDVTVTGTDLGAVTAVEVDGLPATGVVAAATTVTFTTPAHPVGTATVVLIQPGLDLTLTDAFTYLDDGSGAAVTGLSPDTVPLAGGTTVTLTGTGLGAATGVTVDGVPAADVVVAPDGSTITFTAPPGSTPSTATVEVVFPAGELPAGDLTYADDGSQATVGDLQPPTVPLDGGTTVTITGTGLGNATGVTVGGVPAADVVVAPDGSTITFTAPPGTVPGDQPVVVQFPAGELPAGDLTYADDGAGATVTGIDPETAPLSGGTTVTISGTGLQNATGVTVGGVAAQDVVVAPDGATITFTVPAGSTPGAAPVVIVFPAGEVPAGDLTYEDDGTEASAGAISPAIVPTHGGDELLITGTGLQNVTGVRINGIDADDLVVAQDGSWVTATVPPSELDGPVPVELVFPAGTMTAGQLAYEPPSITSLTPPQGPDEGGTRVTIVGGNLARATEVLFDGVPGTDLQVVEPEGPVLFAVASTLAVTAPEQDPGLVDVTVVLPGQDATLADGYGYLADDGPTIDSITPAVGPAIGGTEVTLTGTGLDSLTSVTFDGLAATILSAAPATAVVSTPAHDPGPVDVAFTNTDGTTALPGAFTYLEETSPGGGEDPLTVTGYTPRVGPTSGGQTVTITGTGFVEGQTVVTFDGIGAAVTVLDADTLLAVTPPHPVGVVPLVVTVGAQQSPALTYEYRADVTLPGPPVASGVDPGTVPAGGGVPVTIGGSGFVPGQTSVQICGQLIPADQVTVAPDGSSLTFVAPACAPGAQTAIVITPGGTTAVTLFYVADAVYTAAQTMNGLNPWRLAITGADSGQAPWAALLLVMVGAGLLVTRQALVRRRRSVVPRR